MFEYVPNHVQQAIDLLVSQFRYSADLHKFVSILTKQLQDLEDSNQQLFDLRNIMKAVGKQLDGIGDIVGEPRKGRDDETYRAEMFFRIFVNVGSGEPERMIAILKKATQANRIRIFENYPAYAQFFTDGKVIPQSLLAIMQNSAPAAIGDIPITISLGNTPYFIFGFDPHIEQLYFRTADILLENIGIRLTDGSILEFTPTDEASIGTRLTIENDQISPAHLCTPLLKNGVPLRNYLALALNGGGLFRLTDGSQLYVGPASDLALEDFPWYVFTGDMERDPEGEGFSEVGFMNLAFADGSYLSLANGEKLNVIEREGQMIEGYELERTSFPYKLAMNQGDEFNTDDGSELSLFMHWSQYDAEDCGKLCDVLQKEGFLPTPLELSKY